MMDQLTERVKAYCGKHRLIEQGDHLVLGLSGGPDSVCLFFVLLLLRKELGFELRAVHVNHGIRTEAVEDQKYAVELCSAQGILCEVYREDVPAYAKQHKISEEEAGRELRYRDLELAREAWRKECGGAAASYKIVTAHHLNDQAETVLMHLFRGSGLAGLTGIRPARGTLIRPALCLSKQEMIEYLNSREIAFCTDHTNRENEYLRNRIRNEVLPSIERAVAGAVQEHIAQSAEILQEAQDYLTAQIQERYPEAVRFDQERCGLKIDVLLGQHSYLRHEIVRRALDEGGAGKKDVTAGHIAAIDQLMMSPDNGSVSLPHGVTLRKQYDMLWLEKSADALQADVAAEYCRERSVPEAFFANRAPQLQVIRSKLEVQAALSKAQSAENLYTQYFDYDKMNPNLAVRHRQQGDYLVVNREGAHKSLHRFMIDEKIPEMLRDRLWVVADGAHVVWIPGYRISCAVMLSNETRRVCEVSLCADDRTDQ